jgi:hypothetical protein
MIMDEHELWRTWDTCMSRLTWMDVLRQADSEHTQRVAQRTLDQLPGVTALEALAANARLVELLVGRRWCVIQAAREAGAGWEDIGASLGLTIGDVKDWYTDAIAHREQYVAGIHDTPRARAVLNGEEHLQARREQR